MPPEQLPWDRRDFRKHERSGSDPRFGGGGFGGGGPHRWREQHHHPHAPPPHPPPYHHNNHQQQQRWYSDFRSSRSIPPGHGKQGGWHMYPDDAGPGFLPFGSRYSDRNLEDDNYRPFSSRGDARYFRNSRENRGSFSQKDWRSPSWEPAASTSGPGRPTNDVNNHKSVENTETCHENNSKSDNTARLLPVSLPGQSQSPVKENHEKDGGTADGLASLDQKSEKENGLGMGSMDWKPLKWSRSGSLSSRSSGFSHSSSSKSMGVESERVVDVQQNNVMPVQPPAAVCVKPTAPATSDETSSRKKPRLGWGEGLAKYEKKKVGPEEVSAKDVPVFSGSDTEMMQLPSVNLLDKSPRVASLSDCTSPATPSSVACSFSPGVEEKESIKPTNIDHDTSNLSCSPCPMPRTHYDGPTFSLESLEPTSIANLSSLINELLQSDDQSPVETGYVRTTSMNKLLVWKVNILKAIEVTESEIDSLETELKSLVAEPTGSCPNPATSCLLLEECHMKSCEERLSGSSTTTGPAPSQVVTSGAMISENLPALEDEHVALKDEIDSPGSATSKLIEVLPSGEDAFRSETPQCDELFASLDTNNSRSLDKCLENGSSTDDETCSGDDHKLIARNCHNFTSVDNAHCDIHHIYETILSSNKDSLKMAIDFIPAQQSHFDISTASSVCSRVDPSIIKERFLEKKRSLKIKENAITLKFKVFKHFWKESRVVSIRKLRGKSHKKFDLGRTGCKKNRSSGRSRFSYTAGGPRTVPAEEVIECVNRLLSESPFKPCRNTLKMPALILDKDVVMSRFISCNALVEDPCALEKERSMINPWTAEERELFIDKLAIFGKDFPKIASFLEQKRVADCIEFYYKNHKSESFARARKKLDSAKQRKSQSSTYLVAAGKRWSREVNAASLDILGEASVIAASVNEDIEAQQKCTSKITIGASSSHRAPRSEDGLLLRSNSLDMYSNETVAADVLAGICGSLSSEAMGSCITTSVDFIDGYQDRKNQRISSCVKWPLTPDTQNVDDECSDESCGEMDPADWTDEEKSIFIQAVSSYGKDFLKISRCVGTRSREQCKIFFSKARKCLGLDQIQPGVGNVVSGDVNGGGSDTEDACVVQNCPDVCNNGSDCKMDENRPPPEMMLIHESHIGGQINLKPDSDCCVDNAVPSSLDSMAVEPVSNNLSMGATVLNDVPAVDSNVDSKERDGAIGSEIEVRNLTVSSNTEPVGFEEDNCIKLSGSSDADNKTVAEISVEHRGEDNEGQSALLPEDSSESKKVEGKDALSTEVAVVTSSWMKSESQVAGNLFHQSVDSHSSVQIESGQRIEADLQTCNKEKSRAISLEQNGHFSSVESSMLFSVPIKYQRHSSSNARSSCGANGISERNPDNIVRTVDCQQHVSGYSFSDRVEYSQILRGYPVSVQTLKEINADINCKKHVPLQNVPMQDEKLHPGRSSEFSLQKCTRPKHHSEVLQAPFQSQDRSGDHSRPRSGSSSDTDKPSRSGDVKLFGKILTSSQQKPDSWVQGKGDDEQHRKMDSQTLNLRFNQKLNIDSSQSKFDCNNYPGSENIPVRSFSFWDGNKGNTGFPHLADSALLLAKYPAAFSNHSTPTVKHDNSLNGVSVFPNREMSSSNGVADYHVLRSRELQPFGLDIKQSQEVLFSEMQRRNGFDMGPGMHQQARGMVGINIVGRGGGLLGGGQCSGVSDPVAAIKMHYAKAQNLSMQAGNGVREDDTWTSNGDVGR